MKALSIRTSAVTAGAIAGLVVAQDIARSAGQKGYAFRKGHILAPDDLATLQALGDVELHVIQPDASDIDENEAGLRLARAIGGEGLTLKGPAQSRVNLIATHRGLLSIDQSALARVNSLDGMAIFTLFDRQPVNQGDVVAGAKVAPLVIPAATVEMAEALASAVPGGIVRVRPFRSTPIAVLYREKLAERARDRFDEAVRRKAAWFGCEVAAIIPVEDEPAAVAAAIERFVVDGAGLIFAAGGSSTDPLDATIVALADLGAHLARRGVPAHPGSMFWMAYHRTVPILSLASCSLFSQATIVDIVLPRVLAGDTITATDLAAIGHGGLMEHGMDYRFPPYATETRQAERANAHNSSS